MCILLALIYVQNSITMPHLVVIQLMRVIKWLRSDSDGSCVNKNVCGNKGFYSMQSKLLRNITDGMTQVFLNTYMHLINVGDFHI